MSNIVITHELTRRGYVTFGAGLLVFGALLVVLRREELLAAAVVSLLGVGVLLLGAVTHLHSMAMNVSAGLRLIEQVIASEPGQVSRADIEDLRGALGLHRPRLANYCPKLARPGFGPAAEPPSSSPARQRHAGCRSRRAASA